MKPFCAVIGALLFGWTIKVAFQAMVDSDWRALFLFHYAVVLGFAIAGVGGVIGWRLGAHIEARRLERTLDRIDADLREEAGGGDD